MLIGMIFRYMDVGGFHVSRSLVVLNSLAHGELSTSARRQR
jgi:hypothetical protein